MGRTAGPLALFVAAAAERATPAGTDDDPELYAHPFSSYCQKVLIALYENDTPSIRMLAPSDAEAAAAPALFYADWVHPIAEAFASVRGYRRRLLARPSFARAVDEARPYRLLFPLGAPDRD
jgi:glutathione S-transferase